MLVRNIFSGGTGMPKWVQAGQASITCLRTFLKPGSVYLLQNRISSISFQWLCKYLYIF